MKRLNVLFLPPTSGLKEPLEQSLIEAIADCHHLRLYKHILPLSPQFAWAQVVIDFGGSMGTREMADVSGSVQLWQVLGNGLDHFDLEYWRAKSIPVANCPGELTGVPLAECALMFILMLSRRWHETQHNLRAGRLYEPWGMELTGKVLVIVGFGATGRELARRALSFGMRIHAIDVREIDAAEQHEFGLEFVGGPEELDFVVRAADYLSLNLHLTDATRHILDERRIRLMKPDAFVINVSRGGLVDNEALYRSLVEGRLGGAGLDVFSAEPISPDHPLLQLPNVIATNHVSGNTYGTWQRRVKFAARNVDRLAEGLEPLGLIEKPSRSRRIQSLMYQRSDRVVRDEN